MNSDEIASEVMTAYDVVAEIFDDAFRAESETEKHARWLLEILRSLDARTVLDAGAGTGEQAIRLWQSGAFPSVIANDLNSSMLEKFKSKLDRLGIPFQDNDFHDSSLPSFGITQQDWTSLDTELCHGAFDIIYCLGHSFYHLISQERFIQALRSWNRLLKVDGYVLFDVNAGQVETAGRIRNQSFVPDAWIWSSKEVQGKSGKLYLKTSAKATCPLTRTPLGYWEQATYVIGELSPERRILNLHHFTTGGAILDEIVINEMADATGFVMEHIPTDSPLLHTPTRDFLLRKR